VSGRSVLVGIYRVAQRLYPRRFRAEYGEAMAELLRDQLRDEASWRVCGRTVIDLAVTIPVRHVEVHMPRTRTPLFVLAVTLVAAAASFAFVDGLLGVVVVFLGVALAVVIWRRERPAREPQPVVARWWQFLLVGVGALAIVVGGATAIGELSEPAWLVAMLGLLASVALVAAGVVLGVFRMFDRRHTAGVAV
jgi:hypothetical protein